MAESLKHSLKDYEIIQPISQGGFGMVMKVRHVKSGDIFAMKALDRKIIVTKSSIINRQIKINWI